MRNTMTQHKTGEELAADYAAGIVEGLETLDTLAENIETVLDYVEALDYYNAGLYDTETLDDARTEAEAACGGADALGEVLELWRDLGRPSDASEAVAAWADNVLDVEISGRHTGNGWEVTEVAFLVAYGGPTARVVADGSSKLAVRCAYWSDVIVRRVECDALLNYADALADTVGS